MGSTNDTSRLKGNFALGSALGAGLLSAITYGSVVLGGNTYTDKSQNPSPCAYLGSGSYICYQEASCTGTGGQAAVVSTTAGAYVQNPLGTGAVIDRAEVDTSKNPASSPYDVGTTASLTSSGQNLINSAVSGSGKFLSRNSGALSWPYQGYIRALPTLNATASNRCTLKVWSHGYSVN